MEHKHKFVKYRNRRSRRHMSYKCHGCLLIIVVRKRTVHRLVTNKYRGRVQLKYLVVDSYYDAKDPGFAEFAWRELGFKENHAER